MYTRQNKNNNYNDNAPQSNNKSSSNNNNPDKSKKSRKSKKDKKKKSRRRDEDLIDFDPSNDDDSSSSDSSSSNEDEAPSEGLSDVESIINDNAHKINKKQEKKLNKKFDASVQGQMGYLYKSLAINNTKLAPLRKRAILMRARDKNATLPSVYKDTSTAVPDHILSCNLVMAYYDQAVQKAKRMRKPSIVKKLRALQGQIAIMLIEDAFITSHESFYGAIESLVQTDFRLSSFLKNYAEARVAHYQVISNTATSALYVPPNICMTFNHDKCMDDKKCKKLHICINTDHEVPALHSLSKCPLLKKSSSVGRYSYRNRFGRNQYRPRNYRNRRGDSNNRFGSGYQQNNNKNDSNKDRYFKR